LENPLRAHRLTLGVKPVILGVKPVILGVKPVILGEGNQLVKTA
jgi:hypothetical protein